MGHARQILSLLESRPEGLGIIKISKKLKLDIREVQPQLIKLQREGRISSGLKKHDKQRPYFFERLYFTSHRR